MRHKESTYSVLFSEPVKVMECVGFKVQPGSRLNGPDAYGLKIGIEDECLERIDRLAIFGVQYSVDP